MKGAFAKGHLFRFLSAGAFGTKKQGIPCEMPRVDFRKVIPSDICSKICELGGLGIKLAKERDDFFRIS